MRLGITLWCAPASMVMPSLSLSFFILMVFMAPDFILWTFSGSIASTGISESSGSADCVVGGQMGSCMGGMY